MTAVEMITLLIILTSLWIKHVNGFSLAVRGKLCTATSHRAAAAHPTRFMKLTGSGDSRAPETQDNEDGWGFDIDEEVLAQLDTDVELNAGAAKAEESDLFIPIFSLVALAGLVGAYGYEMLRLFLRGKLYLPYIH